MTENHLTPGRVIQILEENKIEIHELSHLDKCSACYGWMRAFSALKSAVRHRVELEISSDEGVRLCR